MLGAASGEIAGPRIGDVSLAAWSSPPFLELGGGCAVDDGRGDALPGRGLLCLGVAAAAGVHLPHRPIAVTNPGLGQFSRGDLRGCQKRVICGTSQSTDSSA